MARKTIETCRLRLTDREISILREYLHGRTTATTAKLLHLSEGTVKHILTTHIKNLESIIDQKQFISALKIIFFESDMTIRMI